MNIPLKLKPAFKDYIWGGTKLRDEFNKKCDFQKISESWELSCHKDGNSIIENGPDAGSSLADYIQKYGKSIKTAVEQIRNLKNKEKNEEEN